MPGPAPRSPPTTSASVDCGRLPVPAAQLSHALGLGLGRYAYPALGTVPTSCDDEPRRAAGGTHSSRLAGQAFVALAFWGGASGQPLAGPGIPDGRPALRPNLTHCGLSQLMDATPAERLNRAVVHRLLVRDADADVCLSLGKDDRRVQLWQVRVDGGGAGYGLNSLVIVGHVAVIEYKINAFMAQRATRLSFYQTSRVQTRPVPNAKSPRPRDGIGRYGTVQSGM
jgi:hypothetical protein